MAEHRAFLLPVVIDDTADAEARVPEKFRELQWTRLPAGANTDAFVEHVRRLLSLATTVPASTTPRSPPMPASFTSVPSSVASPTPLKSRSFVPWIVGGLLILATGYFVADKFLVSKHAITAAEAPTTAPVRAETISDKSIAVLPFTDMSEKRDQEYFSDGLSEELINMLTTVSGLRVPARTSSFFFKGKQVTLRDIANALRVSHVLEGSVRKSGNRLRIVAPVDRYPDRCSPVVTNL